MRARLAPRAARTAISCWRASARDSSRFATFAHAISSTKPTAPMSTTSERRDVADDLLLQRHDAEGQPAVRRIDVGMIAAQPRGDRVHLGLRLARRETPGFSLPMML